MKQIKVVIPGPIKFDFVKQGLDYYEKRISKFVNCQVLTPKAKVSFTSVEEKLKKEAEILKRYLKKGEYLVVLDERGKFMKSKEFAKFLDKLLSSTKGITFLIGGAEGICNDLKSQADQLLSLSPFTLNHEIASLVLVEAIYRGILISKNHPYHRE